MLRCWSLLGLLYYPEAEWSRREVDHCGPSGAEVKEFSGAHISWRSGLLPSRSLSAPIDLLPGLVKSAACFGVFVVTYLLPGLVAAATYFCAFL